MVLLSPVGRQSLTHTMDGYVDGFEILRPLVRYTDVRCSLGEMIYGILKMRGSMGPKTNVTFSLGEMICGVLKMFESIEPTHLC